MGKVNGDDLRRRIGAGESSSAVRRRFGITTSTFSYWVKRLGLGVKRWRVVDPDRVAALVAGGLTDRRIAATIGACVDSVRRVRKGLGLKPNDGRDTDEYRARMRELLAERTKAYGPIRTRNHAARLKAVNERYGLPADLSVTQVRVVLALTGGPLQVGRLADAVGRRSPRRKSAGWSHYHRFCCPRVPGGNHLTALRRGGLIFSVRTRYGSLYALTTACMDMLTGSRDGQRRDDHLGVAGGATGGGEAGPAAGG